MSGLSPEASEAAAAERYLHQLESTILHAASTGSPESSALLDAERTRGDRGRADGLAGACLELLRRRGWGGANGGAGGSNVDDDGGGGGIAARCDAVTFYALTTLQRSPLLRCLPPSSPSEDDFSALRSRLRRLLLVTMSRDSDLRSMPTFVVTKVGVLLALLVREEYPHFWPRPWGDVTTALGLPPDAGGAAIAAGKSASAGMCLSFLDAVSDEIVYPAAAADDDASSVGNKNYHRERIRRDQVKDALRGYPVHQDVQNGVQTEPAVPLERTDVASVVGWLLNAITNGSPTSDATRIAVRAAAVLKRYLSWIDLRLAANRNLVKILTDGLGGASPGSSEEEDPTDRTLLAVECAGCLGEIIGRGMDERKKLALLTELDVFGALCRYSGLNVGGAAAIAAGGTLDLVNTDATQIEAVAAAAELISAAGLELIQGWELEFAERTTNAQMEQCVELAMACLAYDSIDVSGPAVDLISRILASLEKRAQRWKSLNDDDAICDKIMSRTLIIIHLRTKYPDDFRFDHEDEEEAEEELYRARLRKLYQRVVRPRPDLALQFVGRCLSSLPPPLSSRPAPEVEAALRLVYHYGEGRRPAPGARTALRDAPFREMVDALHRSDVSRHPHREVLLLYYDISVRYSGLLKEDPELLTLFLGSMSGERGLQHPHERVRCRCCYLLLRLVKSVGANAMRPHVEAVVDGCQRLLFPPPSQPTLSIPPDEALYLFEATGILLGQTGLDAAVQVRCATAVLTPHIQSIERTLQSPDLTGNVEAYGEQLSMSISAIAQLSKGWSKHPPPEVQAVLAAAVDVCRNVLVVLPSSPSVRNRTAVLLQRMILCLGEGVLPAMPSFLDRLLEHCATEEDVLDASQLINQLCIKFKERAAPAVDGALLPFLRRVLAVQLAETTVEDGGAPVVGGDDVPPPPHRTTELLAIRKHAFSTLQHVALHGAASAFYSETNAASLGVVLRLMCDGATAAPDPLANKTCAQFFCELVGRWGDGGGDDRRGPVPPPAVVDAFFDFAYGVFVPGAIDSVLDPKFNVGDALRRRVLAEFGRALWLLKRSPRRGGDEFRSRVVETLVLGRGSPPDVANGFWSASCAKDFERALVAWKEGR